MEITKSEVAAVNAVESAVIELNDLELAMIGGGVGDVILV